jgi:hypothetical protein
MTAAFAHDEVSLTGLAEIDLHPPRRLPLHQVAHLCHAIQEALPSPGARIVSFAGVHADGDHGRIAFEAAYAAATQLGLRVLFAGSTPMNHVPLAEGAWMSLSQVIASGGRIEDAMVSVSHTRLACMRLGTFGPGGLTLAEFDSLSGIFGTVRAHYDLIIVEAPPILDGPFGTAIVRITDGAILVVEAERTRAPVALHAKHLIEAAGGGIIGAVLNNRRQFIPGWIYRWI